MKKFYKIFIFLVGMVLIFGIAGCNTGANELQSKIYSLQIQLEEMNNQQVEMNNKIVEMESKIEQLEQEIIEVSEIIAGIAEYSTGTFYTLQEAYDNGWLNQKDLMNIAYCHNGGREYNEEIMAETHFEPVPITPEALSRFTELRIKSTAAKDYREKDNIKDAEAKGFTITEYCGTYGDCVAIMMRDDYSGTTGAEWVDSVAGVNFYYNSGKAIQIWKGTK